MQTTRRSRVDITGCRNHNIGAGYRFFVTAAVERFTQMDLTVFGENRPITVAEQSAAGHINIIKGAVTSQNTIIRKGELLHFSLVALYRNMLAVNAKGGCIASLCGNWCIQVGFQNNGCFILGAFRNLRQRGAEFFSGRHLIGVFRSSVCRKRSGRKHGYEQTQCQ